MRPMAARDVGRGRFSSEYRLLAEEAGLVARVARDHMQLRQDAAQVVGRMFAVEHDPVKTGHTQYLGECAPT